MEKINLQQLEALLEQNIVFLKQVRGQLAKEHADESASTRDYSKWKLGEEWLNKGQFVREVFVQFIDHTYSLEELNQLVAGTFPTSVRGNKTVFVLEAGYQYKEARRYHEVPVVTVDGYTVYVSNQWGVKNWFYLLKTFYNRFHIPLIAKGLTKEAKDMLESIDLLDQVKEVAE